MKYSIVFAIKPIFASANVNPFISTKPTNVPDILSIFLASLCPITIVYAYI